MNPEEIAKKYGATFSPEDMASKYGATFTPETQPGTQPIKQKGFWGNLADVGKGFLKKGTETLANSPFATVGVTGLNKPVGELPEVQDTLARTNTAQKIGGTLETAAEFLAPGAMLAKEAKTGIETYKTLKDTSRLTEMLSPSATTKEAKIAQSEGRLYSGKPATLFRSGKPDRIATSNRTFNAIQTVKQEIPNASKMSPSDLYRAVDERITGTAAKLRPEMEKVPIKPETIKKINTNWETLKKTQMADAPATEEANVAKRQAKFEALLRKSGSGNHADLWDTRITYDNSIPDAVKKANSLSSESLQLQKEEWLQNRKILSEAIDETSSESMKKMSNLYEARNNILSKTKINEGEMSRVNQLLRDNPKVAAALGGATVYEILKHLGVPLP